jgi:hypothetical protein
MKMTASWDTVPCQLMFTPMLLVHAAHTTDKHYFDGRTEHSQAKSES